MASTPDSTLPSAQPTDLLATPAELRAAAKKLDNVADELEREGRNVASAASGGGMSGFQLALAAVQTLGQLQSCNDMNVREIREMAQRLRTTADKYEQRNQTYTRTLTS
ncbi:MAG TPA: type VII secretion target [Micromonosporaceae bacterium]|nr:type VII secretion target [Micromonosporaceae bacterium]